MNKKLFGFLLIGGLVLWWLNKNKSAVGNSARVADAAMKTGAATGVVDNSLNSRTATGFKTPPIAASGSGSGGGSGGVSLNAAGIAGAVKKAWDWAASFASSKSNNSPGGDLNTAGLPDNGVATGGDSNFGGSADYTGGNNLDTSGDFAGGSDYTGGGDGMGGGYGGEYDARRPHAKTDAQRAAEKARALAKITRQENRAARRN